MYEALENGDCTDSFTRDTIMDRLEPVYTSMAYIVTFMVVSFILFVVRCRLYDLVVPSFMRNVSQFVSYHDI